MKKIDLYTDGACSGNPGPGGWGVILRYNSHEKELSGFAAKTTNNRMELMAVIEGIRAVTESCAITVYTDSKYVMEGMTKYIDNWKKNGWKNAAKKPVKNRDLWEALDVELSSHNVIWQWVKGHAGHPENERADALARRAIEDNNISSSPRR